MVVLQKCLTTTPLQRICQVLNISSGDILFDGNVGENDVQILTIRLERLSKKQFEITQYILNRLLEAFAVSDN